MNSIVCNSKEDAVKLLQAAKEFFHKNVDEKVSVSMIEKNLSFIDAVQLFIDPEFDFNK